MDDFAESWHDVLDLIKTQEHADLLNQKLRSAYTALRKENFDGQYDNLGGGGGDTGGDTISLTKSSNAPGTLNPVSRHP